MRNQRTYWYRVLSHYEKNRYYQNGLTLPFLVGSRTLVEPDHKLQTLRELLSDMRTSQERRVTMMRCGYLKEYVFGLLDHETNLMRAKYPKLYKEFGCLIITDDSIHGISSIDGLADSLESEYLSVIEKRTFSKENGKWGEFSSTDRRRLLELGTF